VVAPPIEKVKLLVAKKGLPLGQMLKKPANLFAEKQFTKDDAPKDAVTDFKALEGKTLRRPLRPGDHVFPDDISDGPVTLEVPPGHRAVGLRVTIDAIASGFASLPGSKVDIIWNMKGNNADQTFSMKLLQNTLVLAADMQDRVVEGRAVPASVVTLALTPKDAERVSLASENGTLRLVLRRPDDDSISKAEPTKLSDVIRVKKDVEKVVEAAPVPDVGDEPAPAVEESRWEPIPAPQPRRHTVTRREGDRQWKEVFELEEEDGPDEVLVAQAERPVATPEAAEPDAEHLPAPQADNRSKGG
jgi:pilus assembly protein CpaB